MSDRFEYVGGLGTLSDKALKDHLRVILKNRRYQARKLISEGKPKPLQVRQEHWDNLKMYFADPDSRKESDRMKRVRETKRSESGGVSAARNATEIAALMVS